MLYFGVGELDADGGVMVTASHNPKDYTGMKIVRRGALPVGGDSGLLEIRDRALTLSGHDRGQTPTLSETVDIYPAFVERVLSFVTVEEIKPLRVVIDAGNGMAGAMLPPILERLPVQAVRCFFEPDGSFPNHEPNPLLPENREFVMSKVREEKADLGIAFDGDADRCFFVDDTGEFVPGDFVTALLAESMLEKEPGREDHLRRARELGRCRTVVESHGGSRSVNRVGPRLHQGAHAQGGRALRRRGLRATTTSATSTRRTPGTIPRCSCSSSFRSAGEPLSEILRPFTGALLHHRRAEHARARRRPSSCRS
jgi:phosphomannomutase